MDEIPLLAANNITKSFGGVPALEGMHFTLQPGEILSVIGENGAGKSTLMKVLSGVYQPDAGDIRIDGEVVKPQNPRHALQLGIGLIHQEINAIQHLSVSANLFIGRETKSGLGVLRNRHDRNRAESLLAEFGITVDPDVPMGSLSLAQQQMVEIIKILDHHPRILIMDEPTAALSETEVKRLHEMIRAFVSPSTGVIYISHRLDEIMNLCDRATVIRDGRYIDTCDVSEVRVDQVVSKMVGRDQSVAGAEQQPESDSNNGTSTESSHAKPRPVIVATNIHTKTGVKGATLTLYSGEILGVAGLMGAGRTEFARAIAGADPITEGDLVIDGTAVKLKSPADAVNHGVGYLSEDRKASGLLLNQSVSANIALSSLRRIFTSAGFVRQRKIGVEIDRFVERLHIRARSSDQQAMTLSGGNQQKLIIARWLLTDCNTLIFDEPTRGIDVGAKEDIYSILRDLTRQGKSVLMISSDLREILRMSDRVAVMARGTVRGVLPRVEANEETIMHLATVG